MKKNRNNYRLRLSIYVQYFNFLSDAEKKTIGASPLPILFRSLDYGATEFLNSIFFFRKHKIPFFKYYKPSLLHFKLLFAKLK